MTLELWCLFWASLMLFALIAVQGATVPAVQGFSWGLGPRDEPRPRSVFQGRMDRVVANHIEGLAVFAGLVVVAHLGGIGSAGTKAGALLFLGGRAAFAGLYVAGVPYLRSAAWGVSALGLLTLAGAILVAAAG